MSKEPMLVKICRGRDGKWKPARGYRSMCPDKKKLCNDCKQRRDIACVGEAWCVVIEGGRK